MSSHLSPRQKKVLSMRKDGASFKEIGLEIGCGASRARDVYLQAEWIRDEYPKQWYFGLDPSIVNILGWRGLTSKEKTVEALANGSLHPNKKIRNYGWKKHSLVCKWVGVPMERKVINQKSPPSRKVMSQHEFLKEVDTRIEALRWLLKRVEELVNESRPRSLSEALRIREIRERVLPTSPLIPPSHRGVVSEEALVN